jgi:hypothetical protein
MKRFGILLLFAMVLSIHPASCRNEWPGVIITPAPPPPTTNPLPTATLDEATELKVREFVARKYNVSVSETEVTGVSNRTVSLLSTPLFNREGYVDPAAGRYHGPNFLLASVFIKPKYIIEAVIIRNGTFEETGRMIEPRINGSQAYVILRDELERRGIAGKNAPIFDMSGNIATHGYLGIDKPKSVIDIRYEESFFDYNYYPTTNYSFSFYLLKNISEEKAVYEGWAGKLDSNTGEIISLSRTFSTTFYNIKTREEAAKVFSDKLNRSVRSFKVRLVNGKWKYDFTDNRGITYYNSLSDDGSLLSAPGELIELGSGGSGSGSNSGSNIANTQETSESAAGNNESTASSFQTPLPETRHVTSGRFPWFYGAGIVAIISMIALIWRWKK